MLQRLVNVSQQQGKLHNDCFFLCSEASKQKAFHNKSLGDYQQALPDLAPAEDPPVGELLADDHPPLPEDEHQPEALPLPPPVVDEAPVVPEAPP